MVSEMTGWISQNAQNYIRSPHFRLVKRLVRCFDQALLLRKKLRTGNTCAEGAAEIPILLPVLHRGEAGSYALRWLDTWKGDRDSRQHIEALKRHLHTLKGGARMAGIAAMGNLSHEIEALLIRIDEGRIQPAPQIDELLQQSIDELHRMRDTVIAGKGVTPAANLEKRIQGIISGQVPPESAVLEKEPVIEEIETSEAHEFTVEPEDTMSMVILDTPPEEGEKAATTELPRIEVEKAPTAPPPEAPPALPAEPAPPPREAVVVRPPPGAIEPAPPEPRSDTTTIIL